MNDRWIRLSCLPLATSRVLDIWNVNCESFVLKQKNILVHMVKDYVEVKSLDCHRLRDKVGIYWLSEFFCNCCCCRCDSDLEIHLAIVI